MLLLLLYWLYVALVSGLTGLALVRRLTRLAGQIPVATEPVALPFYFLGGLAFYGALATALSLVVPLRGWVHGLPLLLSVMAVGAEPRAVQEAGQGLLIQLRQWRWPEWTLLLACLLGALYLGALPSQVIDDGVYYQQYLRWLKEYAVVPGLAHLNARFGFNSSWHTVEAFFNLAYLQGFRPELTGLLQVMLALLAAQGLRALRRNRAGLDHYVALCALALTGFFSKMLTAPAMDAALALVVLLLLVLYLQRWRRKAWALSHPLNLLLMGITVFALTIKLSSLALVGFLLAAMLESGPFPRRARFWLPLTGLALLVFLPWLARFYYLTGYLVFPLPEVNLFSPEWKLPAEMVVEERMYIRGFARIKHLAYPETLVLPTLAWLPRWFQEHWLLGKVQLLLGFACLAGYAGIGAYHLFARRRSATGRMLTVPVLIALAGVVYWFFSAPALRFAFGYLYLPVALAGAQILQYLIRRRANSGQLLAGLVALVIGGWLGQRALNEADAAHYLSQEVHWLWPAAHEETTLKPVDMETNFPVRKPAGKRPCWSSPLPCVPFLPGGVKMRGSALPTGFHSVHFDRYQYRRRLLKRFR